MRLRTAMIFHDNRKDEEEKKHELKTENNNNSYECRFAIGIAKRIAVNEAKALSEALRALAICKVKLNKWLAWPPIHCFKAFQLFCWLILIDSI